jgi:hypothetical protein
MCLDKDKWNTPGRESSSGDDPPQEKRLGRKRLQSPSRDHRAAPSGYCWGLDDLWNDAKR